MYVTVVVKGTQMLASQGGWKGKMEPLEQLGNYKATPLCFSLSHIITPTKQQQQQVISCHLARKIKLQGIHFQFSISSFLKLPAFKNKLQEKKCA
jgi:hypothetical protein